MAKKFEVTIVWRTERIATVDVVANTESEAYDKAEAFDLSALNANWDITQEEREIEEVFAL